MSQRLFFAILIAVLFVVIGTAAWTQGNSVFIDTANLNAALISIIAPVILIVSTVNQFFNVVDARVADGKLQPGDIVALFTMSEFYVALVAAASGLLQVFSFELLSPDTQAVLVNGLLALATVVLRSLSNRAPTDPLPPSRLG